MTIGIYGNSAEDRYNSNLLTRYENETAVTNAMLEKAHDLQVATLENAETWVTFDTGYEFSYAQRHILRALVLSVMEQRYARTIELAQDYTKAMTLQCLEIVKEEN